MIKMSNLRAFARYWFIAPLFLLVVGLQLGLGFAPAEEEGLNVEARQQSEVTFYLVTPNPPLSPIQPSPTRTSTPIATASPTWTPAPSRTATRPILPTDTPPSPATPIPTDTPKPQPTPAVGDLTLRVPILMYHYLSVPPVDANTIRRDLSVTPTQFEAHLAYLRQAGYETISLKQLAYAVIQQTPLPPKPVILTFDDGYRDHYEHAFPLLRQYGYRATFFIFTEPIDTYNVDYLTWEMVVEMHQAGMEFGSHSYRHSDLRDRDLDFLTDEIVGSKEAIEARIQEPVRFFCYPSGRYDQQTIRVLASAGFWAAVTTQWGAKESFDNRFELPRVRVRGSDTAEDLAGKLAQF